MPACEIVKEAHKMGVEVYVTDYLADSPAKKIADKSFMVSATDIEAVIRLCRQEKIDGVITGYVDSLLPYYQQICEKAGYPCWGNKENIEICINKEKFKMVCEKLSVPVVPWEKVNMKTYKQYVFEFPVVIKPVDNSGSRGVFKCFSCEDFETLCCKAFEFSKSKELLIEKLMNPYSEFSVYYMLFHSKAYLTGMGDRYVNIIDEKIAPVGQGMNFPSIRLKEWKEKMDDKIQVFFSANEMADGFVFLQGFYEKGNFFLHEIGYRLNGGFSYKFIDYYSKYNQVCELIRFALTGKMQKNELEKSSAEFPGKAFILTVSLKQGIIGRISGIEDLESQAGILEVRQLHFVGDEMKVHGTTGQVFAYILCVSSSKEMLKKTLEYVGCHLIVEDIWGNSMLSKMINPNDIKFN